MFPVRQYCQIECFPVPLKIWPLFPCSPEINSLFPNPCEGLVGGYNMSSDMRFPTMWYVRPAKAQTSLRIRAVCSEPLQVAWIIYECSAASWTAFGVSKLKIRLHRLVWAYTCQNATLLEITGHGSIMVFRWHLISISKLYQCIIHYYQWKIIHVMLTAFQMPAAQSLSFTRSMKNKKVIF